MTGCKIVATGKAVPENVVTNDDLSKIVETSDEWIKKRTGMSVRHHVTSEENTTSLSLEAASQALSKSGLDKDDIDVVVVATLSADNYCPSTAALLQSKLGLKTDIIAIDVNAACSGFLFGLETMRGLLMARGGKAGILVGVETLSKKLDMTDRGTCVLFGDGAAACVVELADSPYTCITGVQSDPEMIYCHVPDGKIHMDGQGTYKFAVATVPGLIRDTLDAAGLEVGEIDHFILHQANLRIIESIAQKLGTDMNRFVVNIEKYGNTSAASVGLALSDADDAGLIKRGDKVLLCAFGAGRTWACTILTW